MQNVHGAVLAKGTQRSRSARIKHLQRNEQRCDNFILMTVAEPGSETVFLWPKREYGKCLFNDNPLY